MAYFSTQILEIDPINRTTTLFANLPGVNKWVAGVLGSNKKIYGIPHGASQILEVTINR